MSTAVKTTSVKGGQIKRDAKTGRFVEVHTSTGKHVARKTTVTTVKEASSKRSAALKRLADR